MEIKNIIFIQMTTNIIIIIIICFTINLLNTYIDYYIDVYMYIILYIYLVSIFLHSFISCQPNNSNHSNHTQHVIQHDSSPTMTITTITTTSSSSCHIMDHQMLLACSSQQSGIGIGIAEAIEATSTYTTNHVIPCSCTDESLLCSALLSCP